MANEVQPKKDKTLQETSADKERATHTAGKEAPVSKENDKETAKDSTAAKKTEKATPPKKKIDPEQLRLKKEEQARTGRRRTRQLLGFVLSILVVVGAVSIVISGINLVQSMMNDTSELKEFETRLTPMVWFDVLPFDALNQIDENALKQVAIWGVLDQQSASLTRNDRGEPLIPSVEVDLYASDLFGPNFHFSGHESFTDIENDLNYIYDPETDMYVVPATGLTPPYLPEVMEVIREPGGIKRVVMGYVSTRGSDNQLVAAPDREHPVKFMDFLFQRDGNKYYLYAVEPNTTYVPSALREENETGNETTSQSTADSAETSISVSGLSL